jgi:hypothetical protein
MVAPSHLRNSDARGPPAEQRRTRDPCLRDTRVAGPRIVPSRSGDPVLELSGPGVPAGWHAMLMTCGDARLLETTGEARYAALLPAFRRGYAEHLAWPEDPIEPLQVGRLPWKVDWIARHQPGHLGVMMERHVPVFERYLRTGRVVLPPTG